MQSSRTNASQNVLPGCCMLSTAYLPPVEYFAVMANAEKVIIEKCEMFQKQSYRTRCHIYSANGLLSLTVPVRRDIHSANPDERSFPSHKLLIDKVMIDYSKPWVQQHKRALEAAYMTTPFFEYYKDDIFAILESGEPNLFNLNMKMMELFREFIGISTPVEYSGEWLAEAPQGCIDLRNAIHPKSRETDMLERMQIKKPYYQVFSNKQGFISNLSVIDLLCNEGPNSISFLKAESYRK